MRLENFLALTQTSLYNEPCVNNFESIVFEARKVKRGDLFFAYNEEEIAEAVQNGAYGVICTNKPLHVEDNEIAWIKSADIDETLKRVLRFKMIEKEVIVYECNEIILKLALQVQTHASLLIAHGNLQNIYKHLNAAESRSTILFSPTLNDKNIFANAKTLPNTAIEQIEIMEQTLFETSFIYDDIFYERQLISPLFMPYLEELLHLYKSLNINFRIRKFTPIEHFEPVFTNKKFEVKSFGASDKVLIFESNRDLMASEIDFLQHRASWANIVFILPTGSAYEDNTNIYEYKSKDEILDILKATSFNFALIIGVDKSILDTKQKIQAQLTLDF